MRRRVFVICIGVLFLSAVCVSLGFDFKNRPVYARTSAFHVVIDAGHGGRDLGASSKNGVTERDINLAISMFLKSEFEGMGVGVTLTRETEHSLANPIARNQKKSDMEERRKIIEKVKPDLVISIHLNSLPSSPETRGFQSFFAKNGNGKLYADAIQETFNNGNFYTNKKSRTGDYFILECTPYPSVLCECGFLSNLNDVKLLQSVEYQKIIAQYIARGVSVARISSL